MNASEDTRKLVEGASSPKSCPTEIGEQRNLIFPMPVDDVKLSSEERPRSLLLHVLETEMSEYESDIAATRYPNPPELTSPREVAITKGMLDILLWNGAAVLAKSSPEMHIKTRQKKKIIGLKFCSRLPPSNIEPRENDVSIAVGKTVWIIHPSTRVVYCNNLLVM